MIINNFKNFDKLIMMIYDKETNIIIECLFFDSLEEYAKASPLVHSLYNKNYSFYKIPVTIDKCINLNKSNIL